MLIRYTITCQISAPSEEEAEEFLEQLTLPDNNQPCTIITWDVACLNNIPDHENY